MEPSKPVYLKLQTSCYKLAIEATLTNLYFHKTRIYFFFPLRLTDLLKINPRTNEQIHTPTVVQGVGGGGEGVLPRVNYHFLKINFIVTLHFKSQEQSGLYLCPYTEAAVNWRIQNK